MKKLLIVEGNEGIIKGLSDLLTQENFDICSNINDAKYNIDKFRYDLVILDIMLPDGNGFELCRYIKVKNDIPVMFLTAKDEGKGIEKEDIAHIFERFYKSKNSSDYNIGIGLALAKSIIENDNGYVNVRSEVNKGTVFEIKYMK